MIAADCLRWMLTNGFSTYIWPMRMIEGCVAPSTGDATASVLARHLAHEPPPRLIAEPPPKQYFVQVGLNGHGHVTAWFYEYPRPSILTSDVHVALAAGTSVTTERRAIDTPSRFQYPFEWCSIRDDKTATEVTIPPDAVEPIERGEAYLRARQVKVYVPDNAFSRAFASNIAGQAVPPELVLTSQPGPLGVADERWRQLVLECTPASLDPYEDRQSANASYREWRVPPQVLRETWRGGSFIPRPDDMNDVSTDEGPFNPTAVLVGRIVPGVCEGLFHVDLAAEGSCGLQVSILRDQLGPYRILVNDWTFYTCACKTASTACRGQHACADGDNDALIAIAVERYLAAHRD